MSNNYRVTLATKLHDILGVEGITDDVRDIITDLICYFDLWPIINELSKGNE